MEPKHGNDLALYALGIIDVVQVIEVTKSGPANRSQ
jgi:hypothetical protein